jgi:Cd2+/Zn2+-exporting ATPase/Cu+-exporting ATPase
MDCAECTQHVKHALEQVPGVQTVTVLLAAEKAILETDTTVEREELIRAVKRSGYSVPTHDDIEPNLQIDNVPSLIWPFFLTAGLILFIVVIGEWMGWFGQITSRLSPWTYLALLILGGYPVFRNVIQALIQRQIISHTLMSIGVIAAAAIGEWPTAVVIVLFMRIGDWVERQTTEGARKAIHALVERAPKVANIKRDSEELEVPVDDILVDDILICRSGMTVAADGEVLDGNATVDTSSITGESVPVDVGAGSIVYSGSIVMEGGFHLRATRVGSDTTIGRVIQLVEQAEANKGRVQRFADRFSGYYLPIVLGIAAITYVLRQDVMAAVSVLVVVCSCAIALATPIAMLASIGAAGKQGLVIKGGRFLEILPKVDIILLDKTGTLTLGNPEVTEIVPLAGQSEKEIIEIAAGVERFSEHPLGKAIRRYASGNNIPLPDIAMFQSYPGLGVEAQIGGHHIRVGNDSFISGAEHYAAGVHADKGQTLVYVESDDSIVGIISLADQLRIEVPQALNALREQGYMDILLLTGDKRAATTPIAQALDLDYRAELLPDDKIAIVQEFQEMGKVVAMIGDGVNDAPALAQADVGIAMAAAGADIAIQAADIALLRDDWAAVPAIFTLANRTMDVVRLNLIFTAIYNVIGLALASLGLIPPALAAAAQSLPDVGILANSSRLLNFNASADSKISDP